MATEFASLPIIDLAPLHSAFPPEEVVNKLSQQLYDVFSTTGFAYLVNAPLTYSHDAVFDLAKEFFNVREVEKWRLAKKNFREHNQNTYRGYFPPQQGSDNLKEGFEIGPAKPLSSKGASKRYPVNLTEPNVWPEDDVSFFRQRSEMLYYELQALSARLLSLLAISLGKPSTFFATYLEDSMSTLRYLHYPPAPDAAKGRRPELCCTPHTDSGILTLLHQDSTGGLEVLNAADEWVAAPYVPGSIVVNIGDLMAMVSGDRFIATRHRVKSPASGRSRYSVPFFFEPGPSCVVKSVDAAEDEDAGVVYSEHVLSKVSVCRDAYTTSKRVCVSLLISVWQMSTWVEFQNKPSQIDVGRKSRNSAVAVEAF
ncbi:MAG: hypothetical protein M1825_004510 [Sarcosagium campestre]|nr:MAG: hypothetical protein M1825_004510 [Sarcosagium campestre]